MKKTRILALVAAVGMAVVLIEKVARAEDANERTGVLSAEEVLKATGKGIDEWGDSWWQWAFLNPNVLGDTTGQFGPLGNVGGPVFFAEGSGGGAVSLQYAAPSSQYILLPVATYIWTFFPPCAEAHCATQIVDDNFIRRTTNVFATVDGEAVRNLPAHLIRVQRHNPLIFLVDAGPIDPVTGYGGILPAEQGGYWLMLEPLPPGTHDIRFGATIPNLDPNTGAVLPGSTDLRTTLTLRVEP